MSRAQQQARAVKRYAANILALYLDADEATRSAGSVWYALEGEKLRAYSVRRGIPAHSVCGAASAISPGMRWEHVLSYVDALRRDPESKVPTYSRLFVSRAVRILAGENPLAVLSGDKTVAFYKLLSGVDADAVVIDGHAFNIARGEWEVFRQREGYTPSSAGRINASRYRLTAQAYREVAELVGEPAHAVQATTWIHWRNITARNYR